MIIRKHIDFSKGLTTEQEKMLKAATEKEIEFDEDCPELIDEQLKEFKRVKKENQI